MTQLDAIVEYVAEYCHKKHLEKLPDICPPGACGADRLCPSGAERGRSGWIYVDLGIYDDPDNQYQGVYSVDLGTRNLMIIGSAQTGKTNILQNIIRSLSSRYTPDEVNIYILDFASRVLKIFDGLSHVGGVVCASER